MDILLSNPTPEPNVDSHQVSTPTAMVLTLADLYFSLYAGTFPLGGSGLVCQGQDPHLTLLETALEVFRVENPSAGVYTNWKLQGY